MLWFYLAGCALLGAGWLAHWRWMKRIDGEIAVGAGVAWERMTELEPEFVAGLSREQFDAIYRRVSRPRFPGYALACVTTYFVALPAIFAALTLLLRISYAVGLVPEPAQIADQYFVEDGRLRIFTDTPPEAALYYVQDLAGFYYFFGVVFAWMALVYLFMRRFHARRPGHLRDEILEAR